MLFLPRTAGRGDSIKKEKRLIKIKIKFLDECNICFFSGKIKQ